MNKLSLIGVVFLAAISLTQSTVAEDEDKKHDGHWWPCLGVPDHILQARTEELRIAMCGLIQSTYIMGYTDGYGVGVMNARAEKMFLQLYSEKLKSNEGIALISTLIENANHAIESDVRGIGHGRFQKGVTEFYSDSRNKQVGIDSAIQIVSMQVKGEKEAYIDCMKESFRLAAQGRHRAANARKSECKGIPYTK